MGTPVPQRNFPAQWESAVNPPGARDFSQPVGGPQNIPPGLKDFSAPRGGKENIPPGPRDIFPALKEGARRIFLRGPGFPPSRGVEARQIITQEFPFLGTREYSGNSLLAVDAIYTLTTSQTILCGVASFPSDGKELMKPSLCTTPGHPKKVSQALKWNPPRL